MSKVDFQTLNEMGLKRLQVSDELVLQESCSKSPTLIFAENGNVIEIIGYKKLLEIRSFIDEILNYTAPPTREPFNPDWVNYRQGVADATREPLSDEEIGKLCKDHFKVANLTSFVRAIEKAHGIGERQ